MINILLPTDFSGNAQVAADFAIEQFKAKEANFVLYHAVIEPRSYGGMLVNITDIMLKDAQEDLAKEKSRIEKKFGEDTRIKTYTRVGYLEDVLEIVVRVEKIDLIAMGTKGESNIASAVLGSNAEHVIRKSVIPVMTIPDETELEPIKDVIIATEMDSLPSPDLAMTIFNSFKETLDIKVLTVLTDSNQKANKSLELKGVHLPVSTISAKKALSGIEQYLKENAVDLLVVYHIHNSRLDYLFSRSITKKMAGHVKVPLLVMR